MIFFFIQNRYKFIHNYSSIKENNFYNIKNNEKFLKIVEVDVWTKKKVGVKVENLSQSQNQSLGFWGQQWKWHQDWQQSRNPKG